MKKLSINICDAFDFYGVERTFEMCKKYGFDAIDFDLERYNLGKGASGAAVQNMNIMLGLDETIGLE